MTYLTLAYDWYLFGHQLPDRLKRGEDIMFFCFHVLKYITEDEFSIVEHRKRTKTTSSSGSSSVIILKSNGENGGDDDSIKDSDELDYIFNVDQDSNDSFSNVSNCDMSITENFYTSNITSRSPNPKRSKTSPISVPRQRHESTSSNGSWQVVTDTGSIDSIMNGSYMTRFIHQEHNGTNGANGTNGYQSGSSCNSNITAKDLRNAFP
uniref:Myotubularin phosphatase domain-containing protein n=1 Tax=Megaselia scalaris TaxID=36166 RepID=T1GYI9_MEGSC